jgi:hypothetical protein
MSYQKHHAPSQQIIQENEECSEDLKVIRPLLGIESNKHQPIVRANKDLKIAVSPLSQSIIQYQKYYDILQQQIFEKLKPKDPVSIKKLVSKKTQTISTQSTTQYPSTSSGTSSKYFSLKSTRKTPLIAGVNAVNINKRPPNDENIPADKMKLYKSNSAESLENPQTKPEIKKNIHHHRKKRKEPGHNRQNKSVIEHVDDEEMDKILNELRFFKDHIKASK